MTYCRCNCGYRCGGPGVCKEERCYAIDDGKHYVRYCDHDCRMCHLVPARLDTGMCDSCESASGMHEQKGCR